MKSYLFTTVIVSLLLLASCNMDICVDGIVLDARTGKPIADAEITLGQKGNVYYSDSAGVFVCHIASGGPAEAKLTVKKQGYIVDSREINLGDDSPVVVKLKQYRVTIDGYPLLLYSERRCLAFIVYRKYFVRHVSYHYNGVVKIMLRITQ